MNQCNFTNFFKFMAIFNIVLNKPLINVKKSNLPIIISILQGTRVICLHCKILFILVYNNFKLSNKDNRRQKLFYHGSTFESDLKEYLY